MQELEEYGFFDINSSTEEDGVFRVVGNIRKSIILGDSEYIHHLEQIVGDGGSYRVTEEVDGAE